MYKRSAVKKIVLNKQYLVFTLCTSAGGHIRPRSLNWTIRRQRGPSICSSTSSFVTEVLKPSTRSHLFKINYYWATFVPLRFLSCTYQTSYRKKSDMFLFSVQNASRKNFLYSIARFSGPLFLSLRSIVNSFPFIPILFIISTTYFPFVGYLLSEPRIRVAAVTSQWYSRCVDERDLGSVSFAAVFCVSNYSYFLNISCPKHSLPIPGSILITPGR